MPADAWATSARVLLRGLAALSFLLAAFPAVAWAESVRFGLWPYHSPTYLAHYHEYLARFAQIERGWQAVAAYIGSNPQICIFASPPLKKSELLSLRKASKEFMQNGSYVLADISNRELRSMDEFTTEIRHYFRMAREGERP